MYLKKMKNVLIIKLGYSETLENGISQAVSFGDVLRTTFVLHFFEGYHVSWLTDGKAFPLLEYNSHIDKILLYNPDVVKQLKGESFDTVVNFEKLKEIYLLCDSLKAKNFFGFSFAMLYNAQKHTVGNRKLFELCESVKNRKKNKYCWQSILAEVIGKKWKNEGYILGYQPQSKVKYDIGFNWTTSKRWTNKAWPKTHWKRLEDLIKNKYSVSWQRGQNNLYNYIEWINSCRLIVTADTLGLHIALALKKRVIGLFGPTSPHEFCFYNCGTYLLPDLAYNCIPCFMPTCSKKRQCMEYILPDKVKKRIDAEFKEHIYSQKV